AAVALPTRGAPFTYFDPNGTTNPRDPIDTWYQLFHQSTWALDPVRLYVGNVAGPVFATSLLAVAVGVAWLAYARRVSLVVLVAFLAGALVAVACWSASVAMGRWKRPRLLRQREANLRVVKTITDPS